MASHGQTAEDHIQPPPPPTRDDFIFSFKFHLYFKYKTIVSILACLFGVQNEMQAVWLPFDNLDQIILERF